MPTELIEIIFSHFYGEEHFGQLFAMNYNLSGWNAVSDIIRRTTIIITIVDYQYDIEYDLYYEVKDSGEFFFHVGCFDGLKSLFDKKHIKKSIRKIAVEFAFSHNDNLYPDDDDQELRYKYYCDEIMNYIGSLEYQLTHLKITAFRMNTPYLIRLPIYKKVIEIEFCGVLRTNGTFQFKKKIPKCKICFDWGIYKPGR